LLNHGSVPMMVVLSCGFFATIGRPTGCVVRRSNVIYS
jgi:hypothetical protein